MFNGALWELWSSKWLLNVHFNHTGKLQVNVNTDTKLETEEDASVNSRSESPSDLASPEMLIKHPLQNPWTLWFFKNDKLRNWEDNQRAIITFNTVEDFWALYNHIELASKLIAGCDYSLFKVSSFFMRNFKRLLRAPMAPE